MDEDDNGKLRFQRLKGLTLEPLSANIIVYLILKLWELKEKLALKMLDWQIFRFKLYQHQSFHPLEVVDRGSETQLQVGDDVNKRTHLFYCV